MLMKVLGPRYPDHLATPPVPISPQGFFPEGVAVTDLERQVPAGAPPC